MNHKRQLLAAGENIRVETCDGCDTVQVHLGSLSLRLPAEAFHDVSRSLAEASFVLRAQAPGGRARLELLS